MTFARRQGRICNHIGVRVPWAFPSRSDFMSHSTIKLCRCRLCNSKYMNLYVGRSTNVYTLAETEILSNEIDRWLLGLYLSLFHTAVLLLIFLNTEHNSQRLQYTILDIATFEQ